MNPKVVLEICADSIRSAVAAQKGGADRIELCAGLSEGGVTPGYGQIKFAVENLNIPVNVLVRPRGGDFLYSEDEYDCMKSDIEICKSIGAAGVVFGILNSDGSVNAERTSELIKLSGPMSATFHRAFDMTRDPLEALETIIDLGFDRILTSGQHTNVDEGLAAISELIDAASGRIIIMAGGGVNENNLRNLIDCGVREIHSSARKKFKSGMNFKNGKTSMSGSKDTDEYECEYTSAERVESFVKLINGK